MEPTELQARWAPTAVLGGLLALTLPSQASTPQGQVHRYDILRGETPVGVHDVRLERVGSELRVQSSSRIDVRLLGLNLYRFRYEAQEVWDQSGLLRLAVEVDDDGKPFRLKGRRDGDAFRWTSDAGAGEQRLPLYPTNHWDAGVLRHEQVLNTLTGHLNRVEVRHLGTESLRLPGGQVQAERYRYTGDLSLDAWYSDQGQWLGMQFDGQDGSQIRYLCATCAGTGSL